MRKNHDSLGEVEVPDNALCGSNTVRGVQNFNLIGQPISSYPDFMLAMARLKKSAAIANYRASALSKRVANAICQACDEIIEGQHRDHFIVALAEGSCGTSINMNFNEVIANRAGQILGDSLGNFACVHPNYHVNKSQSTNDVLPSAIKLACIL